MVSARREKLIAEDKSMNAIAGNAVHTASSIDPVLDLVDVTLQYKTRDSLVTAAYGVSFKAYPGDRTILLGPSGCGKSTLLKAIGGYLEPVAGRILFPGCPITQPAADRGMVF